MQTITLQPGATVGKETQAFTALPDTNYGTLDAFSVWRSTGDATQSRMFIQHIVGGFPASAAIQEAILQLYCYEDVGATAACTIDVERVAAAWVESTLTWNVQPAVAGGVIDSVAVPTAGSLDIWVDFDVTATVKGWVNGDFTNHGLRLVSDAALNGKLRKFHTSDYTGDATLRPKLRVKWEDNRNRSSSLFLLGAGHKHRRKD